MTYRYRLEEHRGGKGRHTCPSCGRENKFARYIDTTTGTYLADHVGRCNREVKCGYHYTPRQFFAANERLRPDGNSSAANIKKAAARSVETRNKIDFIPFDVLRGTLKSYDRNKFIQFLLSRFPADDIRYAIKQYFIGTWMDGRTVFWQIDIHQRVRTGKLMAYDPETGKRRKDVTPTWAHSKLKSTHDLPESFNLEQCLFGEHLLSLTSTERAVAIVESEKTAVIASMVMPDYVWLATGGSNLRLERQRLLLRDRRVMLFPDSSKFESWSSKAQQVRHAFGLNVKVSDLLERRLNEDEKREDYDIADFLLMSRAVNK